jgi:hypothetical protein
MKTYSHGQTLEPIAYDPGYEVTELFGDAGLDAFRRAQVAQDPAALENAWADTQFAPLECLDGELDTEKGKHDA